MSKNTPRSFGCSPSAADLDALARRALAEIPEPFASHLPPLVVQVVEFPDEDTLADLGTDDPYAITGLYHGIPLSDREGQAVGEGPDMIFLYRQPLLAEWCETDVTLEDLITHVIVHEVGHHFGLSDEDMEAIEDEA